MQRVIEDYFEISPANKSFYLRVIPDNKSELVIPMGNILAEVIGHPKKVLMKPSHFYFLTPRSRGMMLNIKKESCLVLKVNPLISKLLGSDKIELTDGAFEMPANMELIYSIIEKDPSELQLLDYLGVKSRYLDLNDTVVKRAIDNIKTRKGKITVEELTDNVMVSMSSLEKKFAAEIGLSPKHFCKIEKFIHFISLYEGNQKNTLTSVGYQCGYYDQSHVIKDFKDLVGLTPKHFFKIRKQKNELKINSF